MVRPSFSSQRTSKFAELRASDMLLTRFALSCLGSDRNRDFYDMILSIIRVTKDRNILKKVS